MGSRNRIALIEECAVRATFIRKTLLELGNADIHVVRPDNGFIARLANIQPNQIIVDLPSLNDAVFDVMLTIGPQLPQPVVILTRDLDAATYRLARDAGILMMEIGETADAAMKRTIIAAARHLDCLTSCSRENPLYQRELHKISQVERAKSQLMQEMSIPEALAYELLRKVAMNTRRRIVDVAQLKLERTLRS